MEVVLLENIKNLGQIGDIVDVKRGHGRNFLIKYGKALKASKENIVLVNKKKTELNQKNLELKKSAKKILDIIIFEMIEALRRNEAVEIRGFGRFKTVMRRARIGRNPKNSKAVQIPAKKAIKWKMSKTLFKRLNKNFTESKISDTY